MLRHSKTRGGALIIYNEREGGFGPENGHPFLAKGDSIASLGEPLEYVEVSDEQRRMGQWARSTNVVRIEVRKGFETAVANAGKGGALGNGVANMLIDEALGRNRKKS